MVHYACPSVFRTLSFMFLMHVELSIGNEIIRTKSSVRGNKTGSQTNVYVADSVLYILTYIIDHYIPLVRIIDPPLAYKINAHEWCEKLGRNPD